MTEPAATDTGSQACIVRKADGQVLVRAQEPGLIQALENNRYFNPDCIDTSRFQVSDRTYVCPYKGTCYWVDLKTEDGFINDVAWVYPDPQPGFHKIAGWFGFYPDHWYYHYTGCP